MRNTDDRSDDEADDDAIEIAIRTSASPRELADSLVALANESGGRDNTTVVVVDFSDTPIDVTAPLTRTSSDDATVAIPSPRPPSRLLDVAAFGSFLVSAAIVVTVIVSALTQ